MGSADFLANGGTSGEVQSSVGRSWNSTVNVAWLQSAVVVFSSRPKAVDLKNCSLLAS